MRQVRARNLDLAALTLRFLPRSKYFLMQTVRRCGHSVLVRFGHHRLKLARDRIKLTESKNVHAAYLLQKTLQFKDRPTLGLGEFVASGSIVKFTVLSDISY